MEFVFLSNNNVLFYMLFLQIGAHYKATNKTQSKQTSTSNTHTHTYRVKTNFRKHHTHTHTHT